MKSTFFIIIINIQKKTGRSGTKYLNLGQILLLENEIFVPIRVVTLNTRVNVRKQEYFQFLLEKKIIENGHCLCALTNILNTQNSVTSP